MNALKNLRIGTRLALAFATVALLMVGMAVATRLGLAEIGANMDTVLHDRYAKVKMLNRIGDEVNQQARSLRNLVIMDSAQERQQQLQKLTQSRQQVADICSALQARLNTAEGKILFDKMTQEGVTYFGVVDEFVKAIEAGDTLGAKGLLLGKLRPSQLAYQKQVDEFTSLQEQYMEASGQDTIATIRNVATLTQGAALLGLLIAITTGLIVTRSVTRPLGQVVAALNTVAAGDLTVDVTVDRGDELGQLQHALADTVAALRRLVGEVRSGIDSVTTASSQIAAGNQDLSSRTEQQASSLQETASSMEELTATVRQSADTARTASALAANASAAASRGGDVVGQVVGTMDEISASSRKIVEIISVIDGIAFQTNILALNAAVEAARAGEQGRGFAVVASEVRVLAQRSAEAAKEIKALIGASVDRVEAGSRQVVDAGAAMQEIVTQVRKVNDLIDEMASTSGEQSRGIEQVNGAVTQMDQVTQQNAALVEESAAAAASLAHQAQALAEAVAVFRTDQVHRAVEASRPRPALAEPRRQALQPPRRSVTAGSRDELAWESF